MRSHTHYKLAFLISSILGAPCCAYGQSLSFGVVAGAGLSSDFRTQYIQTGNTALLDYSTPKRYLVGPTLEFGLPANFSLEVDGIFRPIEYTFAGVEPNGKLNSVSPSPVITWEFPVLAKYRFALGPLKPFAEAGPSFRTAGNLNGTNPSHKGITAGVGFETRLWGLNIAPTLRYTRWAEDHQTTPDQLELMVGISRRSESAWHPLGDRFSAGALLGTNLTDYYQGSSFAEVDGQFSLTSVNTPGPQSFLVGPMLEVALAKGFSVHGAALYQPLHITIDDTVSTAAGERHLHSVATNIEWNFPVLGKYRLPVLRHATPFAELGPSFRLPQGVSGASHYGVTAGAGVEVRLWRLKIAPEFRYTRWGSETAPPSEAGNLNRVEFLTGFSF